MKMKCVWCRNVGGGGLSEPQKGVKGSSPSTCCLCRGTLGLPPQAGQAQRQTSDQGLLPSLTSHKTRKEMSFNFTSMFCIFQAFGFAVVDGRVISLLQQRGKINIFGKPSLKIIAGLCFYCILILSLMLEMMQLFFFSSSSFKINSPLMGRRPSMDSTR